VSASSQCILCGQCGWRTDLAGVLDYLTDEHFDIQHCESCGLRVTHPMPAADQIDRYYPARYRGNRHGFTGRLRVILRRRAIEACFPPGFRGRLLDVGCGDGAFVLEMKNRGWTVCATEIDIATVARLRAADVDAKIPRDAEAQGFGERFDAVTCWHVMEHVERPDQVARWVAGQLKAEGVFQATVPDAECMQAKIFGRQWLHLDVPRHLYHFSKTTFASLLKSAGFSPVSRNYFAWEYDWFGAIQSALNLICFRPNRLFEHLTGTRAAANVVSVLDTVVSYVLCIPIAAVSLPVILLGWALGNGATLTITSRLKSSEGSARTTNG
jgi:SAM-dependent methyltransferase